MVNLKTKFDKHANDNEKRRKSIKEKEKAKLNQSQIIKQALSNGSLSNGTNKKIIFNVEDEGTSNRPDLKRSAKSTLFDTSDSENEDLEIREKSQFSGKKGFELLNLQSTYGNDERFKIDERFLEDEKVEYEDGGQKTPNDEEGDATTERTKQLKILESVLEVPVVGPEKEKKAKKRTFDMVRYDASNKDHEIYEINTQTETPKSIKKRKEGRKKSKTEKEDLPKPQVSKEKFYEVSNELKSHFKEKNEQGGQFSLLQAYGLNGTKELKNNDKEDESVFNDSIKQENVENRGEYKKNKAEERSKERKKLICEPKKKEKHVTAKGSWKESTFSTQDDEQGSEGSLLQAHGLNGTEEMKNDDNEDEPILNDSVKQENIENKTEYKKKKVSEKELTSESKKEEKGVTAKGIWKEPFFFTQDDSRFKEALEFINKKNSSEAVEAAESYDKTRKHIREVLRLHLKKQQLKKDPFKNKIGGMNKKQLANSKLKNARGMFNKRKPPKMNPAKRT